MFIPPEQNAEFFFTRKYNLCFWTGGDKLQDATINLKIIRYNLQRYRPL